MDYRGFFSRHGQFFDGDFYTEHLQTTHIVVALLLDMMTIKVITAEMKANFASDAHLASWAGICPGNKKTGAFGSNSVVGLGEQSPAPTTNDLHSTLVES